MKRIEQMARLGGLMLLLALYGCNNNPQWTPPNIIIILADDMGYSDLGCTGSEIATPNLDKMASEGVLFTNFYNTSRCCPSRASLLTGQYQWDAGVGHMDTDKSDLPEYQGYLNEKSVTIASLLGANGYDTFLSGKWHLGKERLKWPDMNGFKQFYGTPAGGGIYFYPSKFYKREVYWNGLKTNPDSTWYSTDAFTDHAIRYLERDRDKEKPFFMYLPYIAPHFPLQAKEADIAKYMEVYQDGYDAIRKMRLEKQKSLGLLSEAFELPPPTFPEWGSLENPEEEARKMAVYAAMMDCLDQNIGRLMNSLEEQGLADNTIVFFLSDNGAASVDFNRTPEATIGSRNSNASYGKWYNVSNTPYRMFKKTEHEGGIITPMIAYGLSGQQGKLVHQPAHINDFMATCLELAQVDYPKTFNEVSLDPLDGISFLPLLEDTAATSDRTLFWEHEGNRAVRQGNWKLVALHKKEWELYDLSKDPFELQNVAGEFTTIAVELQQKYNHWAAEHGVQSWPLPKKNSTP